MKQFFLNLFSDSGSVSMVRLMSLMVCLAACYIALTKGPEELGMVSVLLATAFGGKVAQKAIEVKGSDAKIDEKDAP